MKRFPYMFEHNYRNRIWIRNPEPSLESVSPEKFLISNINLATQ